MNTRFTLARAWFIQKGYEDKNELINPGLNQGCQLHKAEEEGRRRLPNELYFDIKIGKDFRTCNRVTNDFQNLPDSKNRRERRS